MKNKRTDYKELIIAIIVLIIGAGLTAGSFCIYYLAKPDTIALIIICAVDFLYNFLSTCLLFRQSDFNKRWALKGLLLSVGYTVGFIAVAALFMVFNGAVEFLKNNIVGIVHYAFFTGPSLFIVIGIIMAGLAYGA